MALFDLFKPKWKNSNPKIRISAIREMDERDLDRLKAIALEDPDQDVRMAVLERIDSIEMLEEIYAETRMEEIRLECSKKINNMLCSIVLGSSVASEQEAALDRMDDMDLIARIAVGAALPVVRIRAVNRISNQELLCRIVEQECGKEPARAAMEKITDESLLERISKSGGSRVVRKASAEKLASIIAERTKPTRDETMRRTMNSLLAAAKDLANSKDFDAAKASFDKLDKNWRELDPEAAHELRPAFDVERSKFKEKHQDFLRREAELRGHGEAKEQSVAAGEQICSAIEALIGSLDTAADAQALVERGKWSVIADRLEGEQALLDRFAAVCAKYDLSASEIKEERKTLTEMSEQCGQAEVLVGEEKLNEAENIVKELLKSIESAKFRRVEIGNINDRAFTVFQKIKALKKAAEEAAAAKNREEELEKAAGICLELEGLLDAEDRSGADKRFKALQADWKGLKTLSQEARKDLDARYSAVLDKLQAQLQEFHEKQDWERWHNKTRKEELCAMVEALDAVEDLPDVFGKLKEYQKSWKEIGPVPSKEREPLWQRFREACDRNFERCEPFLEEQKQRMEESLRLKEELCLKAEEHAESVMWKASAETLKQLQSAWKETGQCRRSDEEKLYARFRRACDAFFDRRAVHFNELDKDREQNQVKKEELCKEAEALLENKDWKQSSVFRKLQARWKEIGPAPRKTEQELWERFRAAADSFYSWLDEQRSGFLSEKEALCEEAELVAKNLEESSAGASEDIDLKEASGKISELQTKWKDIGPAPKDKSDAVWERFRAACDKVFEAKRERFDESEKERQVNEEKKREILSRAEELAQSDDPKAAADGLRALQEEWKGLGPAPREAERELWGSFHEICDNFFAGRRQSFEESQAARLENLKKKEALCVRLQTLVGADSTVVEGVGETRAINVADQIKLAMESNFALAGVQDDAARKKEEIQAIQKDWKAIGPAPREHSDALWRRYRSLLDVYYSDRSGASAGSEEKD